MKKSFAIALATVLPFAAGAALAQNGHMMDGGMGGSGWMGGYGGYWMPVLLLAVVALVVWVVMQKRK